MAPKTDLWLSQDTQKDNCTCNHYPHEHRTTSHTYPCKHEAGKRKSTIDTGPCVNKLYDLANMTVSMAQPEVIRQDNLNWGVV